MVIVNESTMLFKKYNVLNFYWDTFAGKIIRAVSHSNWSHTAMIVEETKTAVKVIESIGCGSGQEDTGFFKRFKDGGVEVCTYKKVDLLKMYKDKTLESIDFGINKRKSNNIWKSYLDSKMKYGFESIIGIILAKFNVFTNLDIVGTVICSELVAKLLYDLSDKTIVLGHDFEQTVGNKETSTEEEQKSEFDVPFWRIEPGMISLSRYGDRIVFKG